MPAGRGIEVFSPENPREFNLSKKPGGSIFFSRPFHTLIGERPYPLA